MDVRDVICAPRYPGRARPWVWSKASFHQRPWNTPLTLPVGNLRDLVTLTEVGSGQTQTCHRTSCPGDPEYSLQILLFGGLKEIARFPWVSRLHGEAHYPNAAFFKKREEPTLKHCLGRGSLRSGMGASWETLGDSRCSWPLCLPHPSPLPQGIQGTPQRARRWSICVLRVY